jgi:hypothetical protein
MSETLAKKHMKHLKTIATHTQHLDKTLVTCVSVKQTSRQTHLQYTSEKIDETLETDICNMRV